MSYLDTQKLMEDVKSRSISAWTEMIVGKIAVVFPFVLSSGVRFFLDPVLEWFGNKLWVKGELGLYQLNEEFIASQEAAEFREGVGNMELAPDDIPDDKWEEMERETARRFKVLINMRTSNSGMR